MKEPMNKEYPVAGMEAVNSVAMNSPNDNARTMVGSSDPYRFVVDAPHVPNPDNMGKGGN